jgi:hypothetical protein
MTIENNQIEINGKQIKLGMSFTEVVAALEDVIHIKRVPKERSPLGWIKIKNESFYGLYGDVQMFFVQDKLSDVAICLDMGRYDLIGIDESNIDYDKVVKRVVSSIEYKMTKAFGAQSSQGYYPIGNMRIIPKMSKDKKEYSIIITQAKRKKRKPRASKALIFS